MQQFVLTKSIFISNAWQNVTIDFGSIDRVVV